ncbi:MBL fold metallo-hydrolase [Duganella sp. LX20W]|uniref:MBL fold metallo-hydrolase n=1 Tax=Rugamonas brunnea TaxID=2758569 RepID=A0A7W2ICL8_9BURK|nr:MBL fold metallo-hydrolase [Rugamonas brunnea]MBA5638383.1 MBL fold metallo-hydrolase [Rugamonas brunnea]
MRIWNKGWCTLLALTMLVLRPVAAAPAALKLEAIPVSPHVYYFHGQAGVAGAENQGFMSNAGFVVTNDGVLVFDTLGSPALGEAMLAAIARVTRQPVRRIIISHYHADHFYGLQAFKARGGAKVEVWAHENGKQYLASDLARERLAQRRVALAPWVNAQTRLVPADRWLHFAQGSEIAFEMGGLHLRLIDTSGAHSEGDIMLAVDEDHMLFAGDLFFTGRIPFVGDADSKVWLTALDHMLTLHPQVVVPGHGEMSRAPLDDIRLTQDYLLFLRDKMGAAVADMVPFEEAYAQTDWGRFAAYPAFEAANRLNAYDTYILMERESLQAK